MASRITSFNYSLVSQVVLSMAKKIHLVMSGWFLTVNVVMTNSCANATTSNAKAMKSIANRTNSIANGTNSTAKTTNSTANWTKSIATVTNSIAKTCNNKESVIHRWRKRQVKSTVSCSIPDVAWWSRVQIRMRNSKNGTNHSCGMDRTISKLYRIVLWSVRHLCR